MYKKTRICSECDKELFYSCSASYYLANKNNAKCRNCATKKYAKRLGDCSFLLEESYESLYWIGFLLADGHFSNSKRIKLCLANKDSEHVKIFCDKIGCNFILNKDKNPEVTIMHTEVVSKLCEKFKIKSNKTYFPADISSITGEKLTALTIGFIDGDGCIKFQTGRNKPLLSIKCHNSWLNNLKYMFGQAYIDKGSGYALVNIGKIETLKYYKNFVVENNLPILKRKWDKIIL